MSHPIPVLAVAAAMAFLTVMSLRAWRRTQNRILLFVGGAFAAFFLKSLVVAYALHTGRPGHEDLELFATVVDLLIAGLLVAPFLLRSR